MTEDREETERSNQSYQPPIRTAYAVVA